MDTIYERQVWGGNEALRASLEADPSPAGRLRLALFNIYRCPWSALDEGRPFVEGVPAVRPPGANLYPADMTAEEFRVWTAGMTVLEREQATGFFSVISRETGGGLRAVPYTIEYADMLQRAADHLRKAAAATTNASLRTYLTARATAFLTNDYYESDVAWLNLDSPIDVTIGPYETYIDELFGSKAAFEAFITLRNDEESARLQRLSASLQEIENNLPIDPAYRNPSLGAMAPIRVVDEIAVGGEARAGVHTAAFNLPNDKRIVLEKGSKRVMLKNVQEAKFRTILSPIAARVLDPDQRPLVAFEPFFTHILTHELMHGLGPQTVAGGNPPATVRQAMKELHGALEEAKADIAGLFALKFLMDRGIVDRAMEEQMYVTYLAGIFRSVRFGIGEAHGRGMALQFNTLFDRGAILYDARTGLFRIHAGLMRSAARDLTAELMTLQAEGNYDRARSLFSTRAVIRPELQNALNRLADIPVDIAPNYPLAE
jgi:hypothetical protein